VSGLGFSAGNPFAWLPVLALPAFAANGLRLRARARSLPVVTAGPNGDPAEDPTEGAAWPSGDEDAGRVAERPAPRQWLLAEGVTLDEATGHAAGDHADRARLEVLDLVPGDLAAGAAIDLLRSVDPRSYTAARLARGGGAGQAVLATEDVLDRARIKPTDATDPAVLVNAVADLKKYAPAAAGLAVAPALRAAGLGSRRARLAALGAPVPLAVAGPVIAYAAVVVGAVANPVWGAVTLVAFCAQPYLVFAGTPLRPRGLHRAGALRVLWDPVQWVRTAVGPRGAVAEARAAERRARVEESRPLYAADISAGVDRYLEPRRKNCPWCGSPELSRMLTSPDLFQGKPGTFTLERCRACGHIFQNPRLTVEGLEFYYRDFYDGLGENMAELLFGLQQQTYRERAEMLRPLISAPRSWLDVGTGHGHFCAMARAAWPGTSFDGLDMSDSIEEAERRGWVDRGFRGMFPCIADQIAGSYDVVSMHHYLEHTREPFEELDAAAKALVPGGHLMIEVPDPEWRMGRILKRFWFPWIQPQHQHLIPMANLKEALGARGLLPVGEQRATPRMTLDLTVGLYLLLLPLTRDTDTPWSPRPPGAGRRIVRAAVTAASIPFLVVTLVLDGLLSIPRPLLRSDKGVSYRVVARKVASPEGPAPGNPSQLA
jgi:SAM-dependent methyltransferase